MPQQILCANNYGAKMLIHAKKDNTDSGVFTFRFPALRQRNGDTGVQKEHINTLKYRTKRYVFTKTFSKKLPDIIVCKL